jgi:transcription elongation factor GreA
MAQQTYELSQAAYDRLRAELTELTGVGRIDIARKIEEARALGDLSENGDYHAAKEEQGKMEARIGHLSALLEDCEIIAESDDLETVQVGVVVTILHEEDNPEDAERFLIGMIEEQPGDYDVISPTSPLGQAVMGAKVGEDVSYDVRGNALKVTIIEISR